MINFKKFLMEETTPTMPKANRLEDNVLKGHEGVSDAADFMEELHKHLSGKNTPTEFNKNIKGSPVLFGIHPENGKYFVSTEKHRLPNFSEEDIKNTHGDNAKTVEELTALFKHGHKILPDSGIYGGDVMHTPQDIKKTKGMIEFERNGLTHSIPAESAHGKAIKQSGVGLIVHTKYNGDTPVRMNKKMKEKLKFHPDVHNINTDSKPNPANYSEKERNDYHEAMTKAKKTYASMKPEAYDGIKGHLGSLQEHIRAAEKNGYKPTAKSYIGHLTDKHQIDLINNPNEDIQNKKRKAFGDKLEDTYKNQAHIQKVLELHNNINHAKNILKGVADKNDDFAYKSRDKVITSPGLIAYAKNGKTTKIVDRGN